MIATVSQTNRNRVRDREVKFSWAVNRYNIADAMNKERCCNSFLVSLFFFIISKILNGLTWLALPHFIYNRAAGWCYLLVKRDHWVIYWQKKSHFLLFLFPFPFFLLWLLLPIIKEKTSLRWHIKVLMPACCS